MTEIRYYQFTDSHGSFYYHDPIHNVVQWHFPLGSKVINFETGLEVNEGPKPSGNVTKFKLDNQTPHASFSLKPRNSSKTIRTPISKKGSLSNLFSISYISGKETENASYYPPRLIEDRNKQFDISLLSANLNVKRSLFRPKAQDYDRHLSYEDNMQPNNAPLLKTTEPFPKAAQELFKFILDYCKPGSKLLPSGLIPLVNNDPILIDELYAQILKVLRNNPNIDYRIKGWELFCVTCSIYRIDPQSVNAQNGFNSLLCSFIANSTRDPTRGISHFALISYIRFTSQKSLQYTNDELDQWIHRTSLGFKPIGSCLYEHLWFQRSTSPNCPIPIILHELCQGLLAKKDEMSNGALLAEGRAADIEALITTLNNNLNNNNAEVLKTTSVRDIMSVIKKWLILLPNPIIPSEFFDQLIECEPQNYIEFVNKLPDLHKNTLIYIIGFLRDLSKLQEITNMSESALALKFGPSIINPNPKDAQIVHQIAITAKKFMLELLHNLDVVSVYPLPDSAFTL